MLKLINLPVELLISIYEQLGNIDDALHLGRSCKLMHEVLNPTSHRLSIFSHIIQNGDHHKYDIRLDASEAFCAKFRNEHYTTEEPVDNSKRPLFSEDILGGQNPDPMYRKLDPGTIWSIVSRWHAIKVLFNLYCDSSVRPAFLRSVFWQNPDQFYSLGQQIDLYGEPLSAPSGQDCRIIQFMTTAEKMAAYARFYRTLVSHWLHINITWTAGVSRHISFSACEDAFAKIRLLWLDDCERSSIQQKTEAIEVVDFVWGFLVSKTFTNPHVCSDFVNELRRDDFLHEPILLDLPPYVSPYARLLRLATLYLSPPHIVELLLDMWTLERAPRFSHPIDSFRVNKRHYLRRLGFFDKKQGAFEVDGVSDTTIAWFLVTDILIKMEWWGVDRLLGDRREFGYPFPGFDVVPYKQWQHYRLVRWANDLRGQPILYPQSDNHLIKRIKGNGRQL